MMETKERKHEMKKILLMFVAVAALACLAETITYDDLAPLRPAGNNNTYWNTASRPAVTLNVASLAVGGVRVADSASAPSANSLSRLDVRSSARDESSGSNITTAPLGSLLIMR